MKYIDYIMRKLTCFKCHKTIRNEPFYGLHTTCFQQWFNLLKLSKFYDLDFKKSRSYSSSIPIDSFKKNKNSFYHGRYIKYSAKLGGQQYILKMEESNFSALPAMEYLCNQIASHLGLKTPEHYLIQFNEPSDITEKGLINQESKSRMVFVTKNFMQKYPNGTLHHIYKFLPKGDEHYNCQNIIKVIMEQTNKPVEVKKFIEICLFDSFIGNGDRHGRNLGLIDTGKNKKLAPMYDNPSNFGIWPEEALGQHCNFSGCIWTDSTKEPTIKDYVYEFKRLNKAEYSPICFQFIRKTISQFPKIIMKIKYSEISEKRKEAFIRFLNDRLKDLKQALKEVKTNA